MIVIIRPVAQALETQKRFIQSGISDIFLFSPVDIIFSQKEVERFIDFCKKEVCDSLIFTSQNALLALEYFQYLYDFSFFDGPIFVVGSKTYDKARALGFKNIIISPTGKADGILQLLKQNNCTRPVFGSGRDKKDTLLKIDHLNICELYRAEKKNPMPSFPFEDNAHIHMLCFSMRMFQIAKEESDKQNLQGKRIIWHIVGEKKLYNSEGRFIFYNSPEALYDAFNIK